MHRDMQTINYLYSSPQNKLCITPGIAAVGVDEYLRYASDLELHWAIFNKTQYLGTLITAFAYDAEAEDWSQVHQNDLLLESFDGRTRDDWIQHHDEQELAA